MRGGVPKGWAREGSGGGLEARASEGERLGGGRGGLRRGARGESEQKGVHEGWAREGSGGGLGARAREGECLRGGRVRAEAGG